MVTLLAMLFFLTIGQMEPKLTHSHHTPPVIVVGDRRQRIYV